MPINEADRAYMEEMRMLTRDADGREVLVGLTFEESEWYLAHVEADVGTADERAARLADMTPEEHDAETERYLALHDKHELARMEVLGAEHQLREVKPTRH